MDRVNVISETADQVAELLARFPLLDRASVVIAFSGGKDSVALAHVMRELGKQVWLRAIDMGYSPHWEGRVKGIADDLKLDVDVIKVADMMGSEDLDEVTRIDLVRRRGYLDTLAAMPKANITPCTNCYNCKLIALTRPSEVGHELLCFGHHSDDMISSFLKECIMYHDRWVEGHSTFDRTHFIELMQRVIDDFRRPHSYFADVFLGYLDHGLAMTEEPAYEKNCLHKVEYEIARPLMLVDEETLRAYSQVVLRVNVESSGCGHTMASITRTPRELVQYELLPVVRRDPVGRATLQRMKVAIIDELQPDGSLRADTRRKRDRILGADYKGGNLQDKY